MVDVAAERLRFYDTDIRWPPDEMRITGELLARSSLQCFVAA